MSFMPEFIEREIELIRLERGPAVFLPSRKSIPIAVSFGASRESGRCTVALTGRSLGCMARLGRIYRVS